MDRLICRAGEFEYTKPDWNQSRMNFGAAPHPQHRELHRDAAGRVDRSAITAAPRRCGVCLLRTLESAQMVGPGRMCRRLTAVPGGSRWKSAFRLDNGYSSATT